MMRVYMENQDIRRGIDFGNRLGEGTIKKAYGDALSWWSGGRLSKRTLLYLGIVFFINLLIIYPIFTRDVTAAYTSSAALVLCATIANKIFFLPQGVFFLLLTIISLSVAPVTFYLFVRKIALRHELIAFVASLLYIMPNPFFDYTPALGGAVMHGDGAHAVVFAYLPLFLLYVQSFLATGTPVFAVLASVGTSLIAVISPFSMFNLLIIYSIFTIAEGFLGHMRIKMLRMLFLLSMSTGLSLFWYFPNFFSKITQLSHVSFTIQKIWSVFPLLIPIIPVCGSLFFLVFDRREKLKPIFISLSLSLIYLFLFTVSKRLLMTGVFTPDRYVLEMSFAGAILFAIFLIILSENFVRHLLRRIHQKKVFIFALVLCSISSGLLTLLLITAIHGAQTYMAVEPIRSSYSVGIGSIQRIFNMRDISSLIASLISFGTLAFLFSILRSYPPAVSKVEAQE